MASLNEGVLPLDADALNRHNDELNGKCLIQLIPHLWLLIIYVVQKITLRVFGALLSLEMKCDSAWQVLC